MKETTINYSESIGDIKQSIINNEQEIHSDTK